MPKYSKRITVELAKCELYATTFYNEREERNPSPFNPIGSIFDPNLYDSGQDAPRGRVYVKYVENNVRYVSAPIDESRESIQIKFEKQKIAYIYIDENNTENYYFDLDFLLNK